MKTLILILLFLIGSNAFSLSRIDTCDTQYNLVKEVVVLLEKNPKLSLKELSKSGILKKFPGNKADRQQLLAMTYRLAKETSPEDDFELMKAECASK